MNGNEVSSVIDTSNMKKGSSFIYNLLMSIGFIVMIVIGVAIGIQFMIGSAEAKAKTKETLLPYAVGCLVIFGAFSIWSVAINLGQDVLSTDRVTSNVNAGTTNNTGKEENVDDKTDSNGGSSSGSSTSVVKTSSVRLSETSIILDAPITKTFQLTAKVRPQNSQDTLVWESSDENIVTVKNGKVNAVGIGEAKITVKSGNKSATCKVKVNDKSGYFSYYYNLDKHLIREINPSSTVPKTAQNIGFWIDIPEVSFVKEADKLPLIIYLHGISANYVFRLKDFKNAGPFHLEDNDYPAIVVYPLCPEYSIRWEHLHAEIRGLIDYLIENYNVDENKVALTGSSWGGSGVWEIAVKYPTLFSCLVPVSGYCDYSAEVYPDCPAWIFGSTGDGTEYYSRKMAEHLGLNTRTDLVKQYTKHDVYISKSKKVRYELFYDMAHGDVPGQAYKNMEYSLIDWMIARDRRTNAFYEFEFEY